MNDAIAKHYQQEARRQAIRHAALAVLPALIRNEGGNLKLPAGTRQRLVSLAVDFAETFEAILNDRCPVEPMPRETTVSRCVEHASADLANAIIPPIDDADVRAVIETLPESSEAVTGTAVLSDVPHISEEG